MPMNGWEKHEVAILCFSASGEMRPGLLVYVAERLVQEWQHRAAAAHMGDAGNVMLWRYNATAA